MKVNIQAFKYVVSLNMSIAICLEMYKVQCV